MEIPTNKTKYFHDYSQANLLYQEDLDALTPDRIMKFIMHHSNYQRPRLQNLDRYYQGYNTAILDKNSRRQEEGKADYRATHSFGKYIADFQTAYSVGNPVNVKVPSEDKRFDAITRANDVDAENYDLFLDMTRYGRAYELVYRGKDNLEHLVRLDPLDTFVIYSLDVDPQPIMAVRYHQVEIVDDDNTANLNYMPEFWTATQHVVFKPTALGGVMNLDRQETLTTYPVTEFKNNNFRLGDFENVIPLIDLYDAAQSDTANYMTDLNDAMLIIQGDIDTLFDGSTVLQGVDPGDEDAAKQLAKDKLDLLKEMKQANMLLLKSGFTSNGTQTTTDAKYINKQYDVQGTEAYKQRLANDIHKFSHTPDLTDENFASNASGVAMKYKLLGTVELAATKRRMFEKGLYNRYNIIASLERKASAGWTTDPDQLQFTFRDNLPTDDLGQIQQIYAAGATLPQQYLYRFLPGITDPEEITKMIQKQRSEDGDYQARNPKVGEPNGGNGSDAGGDGEGIRRPASEGGQEQSEA